MYEHYVNFLRIRLKTLWILCSKNGPKTNYYNPSTYHYQWIQQYLAEKPNPAVADRIIELATNLQTQVPSPQPDILMARVFAAKGFSR